MKLSKQTKGVLGILLVALVITVFLTTAAYLVGPFFLVGFGGALLIVGALIRGITWIMEAYFDDS